MLRPGQRRLEHHRRPHRRADRRDRPGPTGAPQEAAGPRGRRRRLPRPAGLADRPGRQTRPQRGVLGRVRGHRAGPHRHQPWCPTRAWAPAIDADGDVRDGGDVAEVTGLLDLTRVAGRDAGHHPPGTTRTPARSCRCSRSADGWRYQAVATNTTAGQLAFLEARHRAHARVEDRIRHAKDTGLGRFPSREFAINQAWLPGRHPRRRPDRLAPPARPPGLLSRRASRRRCATGSCTSPPASPAAPDDDGCGCPRRGRGPSSSRPSSTRSPPSPPDLNIGHHPDRPPPETSETRTAAPRATSIAPTSPTIPGRRRTCSVSRAHE